MQWKTNQEVGENGIEEMYPLEYREHIVSRALEPGGPTVAYLCRETGVDRKTISRWVDQAGSVDGMARRKTRRQLPNDRPPTEKLRLVTEASGLSDEELGAFLRKNGIHRVQLEQWRQEAISGLGEPYRKPSSKHTPEAKKIRELKRELERKDKALAETAALLVLKKKAQAIWGEEDDDTTPRSGE
jgi:transposase